MNAPEIAVQTGAHESADRPGYRPFDVAVARLQRLSPHFIRITFTGADLGLFGTNGFDQRVKIVLPTSSGGVSDIGAADPTTVRDGTWYQRWRNVPEHLRSPIRTYTVRAVRPGLREVDVDFVVHEPAATNQWVRDPGVPESSLAGTAGSRRGPAARWLARAAVGDRLVIVGPDATSRHCTMGIDWQPGGATDLLLVGDETAVPAICAILESLPAERRARAFIEVPSAADAFVVVSAADVAVSWLARDASPMTLESAVRAWVRRHRDRIAPSLAPTPQLLEDVDVDRELLWDAPVGHPGGHFYAWVAGESALVKGLRRLLVSEAGLDRSRVAFMGYWRSGKAEAH